MVGLSLILGFGLIVSLYIKKVAIGFFSLIFIILSVSE